MFICIYIYICAPCKIKNNCPFGLLMVDSFMLWLHNVGYVLVNTLRNNYLVIKTLNLYLKNF